MTTRENATTLIRGERAALRIWRDEAPMDGGAEETRPYETLGYVVSGVVEVVVDGKTTTARAGDAYVVPAGAAHRYRVVERLTAVETTVPAA